CRTRLRPALKNLAMRCGGALWESIAFLRGATGKAIWRNCVWRSTLHWALLTNIHEVRVQPFDGTRKRDFHPLPERRLIMHLAGEVEIGTSDGSRHVFGAGDIRLMEDVTGRGHTHVDRSPSSAVYVRSCTVDVRVIQNGSKRGMISPWTT